MLRHQNVCIKVWTGIGYFYEWITITNPWKVVVFLTKELNSWVNVLLGKYGNVRNANKKMTSDHIKYRLFKMYAFILKIKI